MDIPIFFPSLRKGSTKDHIIELLTKERSLTNQQIFNRLKKEFMISKSYQTIRQALMELVDTGILEKNKKDYKISIEWIKAMDSYIGLLKKKYIENKNIAIIDNDTKEIELNSLYELGHFILYSFREYFFDVNRNKDLYMFVHHLWVPFFNKKKRDLLRDFFSKNKNYIYVRNKSFLNKILTIFYKRYGDVKLNVRFDEFFDIIVQGDCIVKIHMPKELRKRMDNLYRLRSLNFNIIEELTDMTFDEYKIKLIITRDKNIVNDIKEKLRKI